MEFVPTGFPLCRYADMASHVPTHRDFWGNTGGVCGTMWASSPTDTGDHVGHKSYPPCQRGKPP